MEKIILLRNLKNHINKMLILGQNIDSNFLVHLSLLNKYKTYTEENGLETLTINNLLFKIKKCSQICK